jgi:hypothetical protein
MPTIQLSPEDRNLLLGIRKDLDSLKRLIKKEQPKNEEWLSAAEVEKQYSYKASTLRKWRQSVNGKPAKLQKDIDWRVNMETGRKPQYLKSTIQNLFDNK